MLTQIQPSGVLSQPLEHLAILVAASTTFQSFVGAASAAAALAYIGYIAEDDDADLPDRFALVLDSEDWRAEGVGQGSNGFSREVGGTIGLRFESLIPDDPADLVDTFDYTVADAAALAAISDPDDGEYALQSDTGVAYYRASGAWVAVTASHGNVVTWFNNKIGAIISEMDTLAGTESGGVVYLAVHEFAKRGAVVRSSYDEAQADGDRLQLHFDVRWGP